MRRICRRRIKNWKLEKKIKMRKFKTMFLFKNVFIFSWRIIVLQCCFGFCHKSALISPKDTYVPFLLNLSSTSHPIPPLYVVTERWKLCFLNLARRDVQNRRHMCLTWSFLDFVLTSRGPSYLPHDNFLSAPAKCFDYSESWSTLFGSSGLGNKTMWKSWG